MFEISTNIKKFRKEKKISQGELAKLIEAKFNTHMAQNTISQYEKGSREPSLDIIHKIADILEVSINDLLGINQDTLDSLKEMKYAGIEALKDSPIHPFNDYLHKQFGDRFDDLLKTMTAKEKQEVFIRSNEYIEVVLKLIQIEKEAKMKYEEKENE